MPVNLKQSWCFAGFYRVISICNNRSELNNLESTHALQFQDNLIWIAVSCNVLAAVKIPSTLWLATWNTNNDFTCWQWKSLIGRLKSLIPQSETGIFSLKRLKTKLLSTGYFCINVIPATSVQLPLFSCGQALLGELEGAQLLLSSPHSCGENVGYDVWSAG